MKQIILCASIILTGWLDARSIHRKADPNLPQIQVSWFDENRSFCLRGNHLQKRTFFNLFDRQYYEKMQLPTQNIPFRNQPKQSLSGAELKQSVEKAIDELLKTKRRKKELSDFTILQKKDYNFKQQVGLIILKSKQHPFVVKVFIEHPETFINPFNKGLEPIWFYFMGGGINRHLSGFTRISNLQSVKKKISANAYWASIIDLPRKWYLHPKQSRWIKIAGKNVGSKKHVTFIPSIYCIVADAIEAERTLSLSNVNDRHTALSLCNYLSQDIDSHINNFMLEKQTQKIVIIDTEHFPSVVGFRNDQGTFSNYTQWYLHLAKKCAQDTFFTTKKEFKLMQQEK